MASEMVNQVLEAEERAKQSEQEAARKAVSIREQAVKEAQEILLKEAAAANIKAKKILQEAAKLAQENIGKSEKVIGEQRDKLREAAAPHFAQAVANTVAAVISTDSLYTDITLKTD